MKQLHFTKIAGLGLLFLGLAVLSACQVAQKGSRSKQSTHPEAKLGWKLGSQAYTFKEYTFAEAVDKIDSCNLRFVEAYPGQTIGGGIPGRMGPDMDASTRKAVLELLKVKNVQLMAFGVTGADSEADWTKLFEFAKAMGIQTITSEPNEKFLPFISNLCDKYQINLAIHNHPNPSQYWNPDIVLKASQEKSKRIGACADIGHWVRSGLDPVACLKTLEGRVFHLHMKDLHEKGRDGHDVHWGEGVSDIPGVIDELKRQNFKGGISAEYEYNWKENSKDVAASVVNFRKIISSKN
ncbi:sugar phosphate isomerase/epimerase family protein [Pedobacter hiemivivus]|uniref:Sugar phosphate isomerase/epimerase n=1 Tax=Pedobacter hiemivivus TaxID=2530454 RepID=A0A4R0NDK5_9SPHI|nr:sugar phosphate isomerase/epimerase [Pedobacter hiemivivus]TCC97162.1 sugar phosphate isomerase/epimerase [Pedobacter hiemivivus]